MQEILVTAILRQNTWTLAQFEAQNSLFLGKISEKGGAEIRQFPEEVLSKLRELTKEVIEEMVANDPQSKKIYDSYSTYRDRATAWSELTEKIYYSNLQGE